MLCSCTFKKKPNPYVLNQNQTYITYSPGVTYKFNKNLGANNINKNTNIINSNNIRKYLTPS
jgi:hypothetical protein